MSRRGWSLVLAVVALIALACKTPEREDPGPGEPPAAPVDGYPSSMVALGDSLTAGYGTCLAPSSCPRNSWATGDGTQVTSHYRRILAANPAIEDRNRNLARPGASAADLADQAAAAVASPVDYVTILIGGNDACRGEMTPVGRFRDDLDRALATLKEGMPDARVLFVSIPDIYRVWQVGHTNKIAVGVWDSGVCPNLLANATSQAAEVVAMRTAFRERIAAYNGAIREACGAYGPRCRFDDVADLAFELTMLSAIDFFHPNASGQRALADQTYPDSFTW
jgi:lysophospholipase L1-like esterase